MKMLPSLFGESFFDDFMDYPLEKYFPGSYSSTKKNVPAVMKTDLREKDGNYEIIMDLPGINKENVKIELDDGYLSVSASANSDSEEKDSEHKYIKKERYRGSYKRVFFVGDHILSEDIKAKFENGVLIITFPKKNPNELKGNKFIEIE